MSVVSNIHTAVVYSAKGADKTLPQSGQRLVVTIAKADSNGNYGQYLQQTMATSIPQLATTDIDWINKGVQDACVEYFETVQNQIISGRIKEGKKEVTSEELEITAILDYLNSESIGERWNPARVATWFTENLAEYVGLKFIESGMNDDAAINERLEKTCKDFSNAMGSKAVINAGVAVRAVRRVVKTALAPG